MRGRQKRGRARLPLLGAFLALALLTLPAASLSALDVPRLTDPVMDTAGIMSGTERQELSAFLTGVSEQTGVQLAVLTLASLEGEPLEDFSMRVAEAWKLGRSGQDNGILLLVSLEDRAIRIEVGYGLEDKLTDAKSGLIIRNVLAPQFRAGRYGQGIAEAARNIVGIATDNASIVSESVTEEREDSSSGGGIGGMVFFLFFLIFILPRLRGRGILGPIILGSMLSSGRRGNWSGGSGRGFSSGGGFSGGGGSFGGGGASGGW